MKHIFQIFKNDVTGICSHLFALIIAIGICVLPALYAWLNIYSNWDPYANTGELEIAVVNMDKGFCSDEGENIELGASVVEELKQSESIHWVFLSTQDEAMDGVKSGKYYAAIVLDETFSADMYNGIFESGVRPKLHYYVNGKKNAIATKITDTAVSTLENSIDEQYVQIVTEKVFTSLNIMVDEITDEYSADKTIHDLENLRENLLQYDTVLAAFLDAGSLLDEVMTDAQQETMEAGNYLSQASERLSEEEAKLDADMDSFDNISLRIDEALLDGQSQLNTLLIALREARLEQDVDAMKGDLDNIAHTATDIVESMEHISALLGRLMIEGNGNETNKVESAIDTSRETEAVNNIRNTIVLVKAEAERLADNVDAEGYKQIADESLQDTIRTVEETKSIYDEQVYGAVHKMLEGIGDSLQQSEMLIAAMGILIGDTDGVLRQAMDTSKAVTMSIRVVRSLIHRGVSQIDALLADVKSLEGDEKIQMLNRFLHSDVETVGNFFKEPVQMEENYIFPVKNYGSGVAPFYTVLAIWVGMTILSAIIVIRPETGCYPGVKMWELYFGRYLLFMVMSLIQTAVIVAGDLYIFRIQCVHPGLFWLAAIVCSITFSLLVYTLALSFGDVGKALCIIIMVIQIAGSGGTFPIEALPEFFRNVYIFFPFPYIIDAMRECVGGMYGNVYWLCLGRLGVFCAVSLLVGLVIRLPFIGLFDFFEERLEETDMM